MKSNRFKIVINIFTILGLLFISYILYYTFLPEITNYKSRIEFEQERWKNWEETESTACLRWDMTDDLIDKHQIVGKSVKEIIELLGEPNYINKNGLRYYLGMSRHGIDTGSLQMTIENDIVIDYKIWHG